MNLGEDEAASPATSETEDTNAAAAAEDASSTDDNSADSSAADDKDAKQPSLIDVVTDAVKPKEADAGSSTAESVEGDAATADADAGNTADADAGADDAEPPFHNHPRWKQLIAERDELKPSAEAYQNITGFMTENGLSGKDVADGFEVMADLKSTDPTRLKKALDWLEPRVQGLREMLGNALPDDLQQKLDEGLIDEDTAKELAQSRANARLHEGHSKAVTERTDADRAADAARTAAHAAATAVQAWETDIRKSDPDYAKKAELVESTVSALVLKEGKPKDADAAVALVKRAYEKVDATFKAIMPPPKPKNTATPAGSSARIAAQPPKTLLEAVEQAVAQ